MRPCIATTASPHRRCSTLDVCWPPDPYTWKSLHVTQAVPSPFSTVHGRSDWHPASGDQSPRPAGLVLLAFLGGGFHMPLRARSIARLAAFSQLQPKVPASLALHLQVALPFSA